MQYKHLLLPIFLSGLMACSHQATTESKTKATVDMSQVNAEQVLLAHDWRLTQLNDHNLDKLNPAVVLSFKQSESRVSGFSGCNRFSASYQVSDSSLIFDKMLSTQMACEAGNIETEYLKVLATTRSYLIKNASLTLLDANHKSLASFVINNRL